MKLKLNTKYTVAIIISLIIGASILGYGYLDYRYKKEALEQKVRSEGQTKIERESKEEKEERLDTMKQLLLQNCLDEASERFGNAVKDKKNISYEGLRIVIDLFQKQKDECFKKYPQK